MSRLRVSREGSVVILHVHAWQTGTIFAFKYDCNAEWAARLLVIAVEDALMDSSERIRRDAYADGWKDAKAKRRKATWFSRALP